MSQQSNRSLGVELVLYRGGPSVRRGWTLVAAALVLTVAMFVFLPFVDMISARPQRQLDLRSVELVRPQIKPPQLPEFRPPKPVPEQSKPVAERPKPKLDMPRKPQRQRSDVKLQLSVPADDFAGDFVVDLGSQIGSDFGPVTFAGVGADFGVDLSIDFSVVPELDESQVQDESPADTVFSLAELDRAPKPTLQVPPVYPYRARARSTEGHVEVVFTVTPDGHTKDLAIAEAVPGDVFVASVQKAVARWRFDPGMKDGKPVAVRMSVKLRFELE